MKIKIKFFVIAILVICLIIFLGTKANAAMEIKAGTTTHKNITVSDAYQYCYDLRNRTSTLSKNTLDPHLSLNADWGAVACLSLSSYGYGKSNNLTDTFTNGNNTGVIDFCKTPTYTSGIRLKKIDSISSDDKSKGKLVQNINTKYVEGLKEQYTQEDTVYKEYEFLNQGSVNFSSSGFSVPVRSFYLGRMMETSGNNTIGWSGDGETGNRTFRPVIWN